MPQAVGFAFALARGDIAFVRIGRRVIFSHGLHGAVGFIVAIYWFSRVERIFEQISEQCEAEAKSKQSSFSCELLKIAENIQSRRVANLKFLVKSPIILRTL